MFDATLFPNATDQNRQPDSDPSTDYNCLGWAVHSKRLNIWPDFDNSWPVDMPRVENVDSIVRFLERLGFADCNGDISLEAGFEKVAIYSTKGVPQHVARQRPDGKWTSKLNRLIDIWHLTPYVLANPAQVQFSYGIVVKIMRRRWNGPPVLPEMFPPPTQIIRS